MEKKEKIRLFIPTIFMLFIIGNGIIKIINAPVKEKTPQEMSNLFVGLELFMLIFGSLSAIFAKKLANNFYRNIPNLKNKFSLEYLEYNMKFAGLLIIIGSTLPFLRLILNK